MDDSVHINLDGNVNNIRAYISAFFVSVPPCISDQMG